ncbi:putative uba domain-containing protein ucp14 [Rosellinia necatrix]|uniref:Putative uba domain-containing protein ucp14 n=1 Tax=Rosellinia necatrix TaxID=77044 RepID=A0A1W2TCK9_ROSNE|nr:putative uba domain-containing protein ucp14 [Rosellinia necatrix]
MSFTNAPVTRSLVYGLVGASIAASLLDIKHYFYILVDLHLWRFHQTWRALIYQLCYTNSSEVLFAAMTLYNMRSVERLWGSRKYATFVFATFLLTSTLSPVILALVVRPLSLGVLNYLPAGPTPIIFAVLAQYHAMIPHTYKYKVATSLSQSPGDQFQGVTLSDKTYRYLLALQLAVFQWPGSLLGALIGWVVGYAWRMEVLPRSLTRWRIPGWIVGIQTPRRSHEFEGLRRRLADEGTPTAATTGAEGQMEGGSGRRRTAGQ